jgi:hypothetical protein
MPMFQRRFPPPWSIIHLARDGDILPAFRGPWSFRQRDDR